jgi:hypothetical protein
MQQLTLLRKSHKISPYVLRVKSTTCLSGKKSIPVIKSGISPYEKLTVFDNFEVIRAQHLIDSIFNVGEYEPKHIPDHSLLCWTFSTQVCVNENVAPCDQLHMQICDASFSFLGCGFYSIFVQLCIPHSRVRWDYHSTSLEERWTHRRPNCSIRSTL